MNIAVLLAGGSGTRMKASIPKQHLEIRGHQLVEYTLQAYSMCKGIDKLLVVSHRDWISTYKDLQDRFPKLEWIIEGGSKRSLSVYNAVVFLAQVCGPEDFIIMADAVRPCITNRELSELLASLKVNDAATSGMELYETVLKMSEDTISDIFYRDSMFRQTSPEAYRFESLRELYLDRPMAEVEQYQNIGIDQLHGMRKRIGIVRSTPLNFKITTSEDLLLFDMVVKKGFENYLKYENLGIDLP